MVGVSVLYFVGILSIHESPVWYLLKNRKEDALKANIYYKGKSEEVDHTITNENDTVHTFSFKDFGNFSTFLHFMFNFK